MAGAMSRDNKILLAALACGAVLVPAVVVLALRWPWWAWLLGSAALLAGVAAYARRLVRLHQQEQLREALVVQQQRPAVPAEPEPEPPRQRLLRDVPLPSSEPDYRFVFGATAWWRRPADAVGVAHENPAGLAVDVLLTRAREIAATEHPGGAEVVAHKLAGALGAVQRDPHGHVEVWAADVTLVLPEQDVDRLHRLAEVRKDEQLWHRERDHERSKRAYLADEVLQDTGSAVVWWLARNENDVERAAELIGTLAQLSAAANGTEIDERFRHLVPSSRQAPFPNGLPFPGDSLSFGGTLDSGRFFSYGQLSAGAELPADAEHTAIDHVRGLLDELSSDDEDADRDRLAGRLATLFDAAGQAEFAAAIRHRFGNAEDGQVPAQPRRSST
ncbi:MULTISPECIES: hypothetical protein [unclassified Saccharopolyspora]|uniref:hypothetical protein n=1 Tax=unclassified Saccharopolyspora TaxID=2646250 RepID=UPI001CD39FD2|nr:MULTISPECIES: hypothetical protein [unclassified Saccharopolyspora]MCA1185990.1 hypothetical protein [Saccharopolyspora sp. 6T]MCA1192373.1 hypothetical protein [Saccharopolyspora sp. 6V]MCA1227959.1 hypothetical protein [Saccharopolyspora sp. 6M]